MSVINKFVNRLNLLFIQSKFGLTNLFIFIYYHFEQFNVPLVYKVTNTSFTDSDKIATFGSLCAIASTDDKIFKKFRLSRVLIQALDHVSIKQGYGYLQEIIKIAPWNTDFKHALKQIDSLGNPIKYKFNGYGFFSPTSLRYLKVHLDLTYLFHSLNELDIVEIGVGFGGQAMLTNILSHPNSYSLYDIPPVLDLSQKFIKESKVRGNFIYYSGIIPEKLKSDLVISNYAFSELNREIQDLYLKNVILNSKRGYITWNYISEYYYDGYSLADLLRIIPGSQMITEKPLTSPSNAIIVWGHDSVLSHPSI
jgi:putative sugar O-methyltransferase